MLRRASWNGDRRVRELSKPPQVRPCRLRRHRPWCRRFRKLPHASIAIRWASRGAVAQRNRHGRAVGAEPGGVRRHGLRVAGVAREWGRDATNVIVTAQVFNALVSSFEGTRRPHAGSHERRGTLGGARGSANYDVARPRARCARAARGALSRAEPGGVRRHGLRVAGVAREWGRDATNVIVTAQVFNPLVPSFEGTPRPHTGSHERRVSLGDARVSANHDVARPRARCGETEGTATARSGSDGGSTRRPPLRTPERSGSAPERARRPAPHRRSPRRS